MSATRRLLIVGGVTFAIALVALFPARLVSRWALPDDARINGVSGSVWHGRIAEGVVNGVYFRNLDWRLRPWSLLTGKLAYRIDVEPAGGFADGEVAVTPGGRIILTGLAASLPLAAFDRVLLLQGIEGELSLQIARARLDNGWPHELQGTISVSNLLVRVLAGTPIGSYRAEFQSADDEVTGSVEDTGGVLTLAGTLQLGSDRSYALRGRVGARDGAPASLIQQLRYLGTPDERGLREFRFEGAL